LDYLEALEAGRISALPSNAHALGFLRTYAAALGLDPNDTARRFKAEAVGVNE
jgi:cytoskeleton protein RodZ